MTLALKGSGRQWSRGAPDGSVDYFLNSLVQAELRQAELEASAARPQGAGPGGFEHWKAQAAGAPIVAVRVSTLCVVLELSRKDLEMCSTVNTGP